MGLFSKNNQESQGPTKKPVNIEEAKKNLLEKYDLKDIDPRDLPLVEDLINRAAELGLDDHDNLPLRAIELLQEIAKQQKIEIDQRFLLIKQNDRINKSLEQVFYLLEDKHNM
jgi:hypothetical protein